MKIYITSLSWLKCLLSSFTNQPLLSSYYVLDIEGTEDKRNSQFSQRAKQVNDWLQCTLNKCSTKLVFQISKLRILFEHLDRNPKARLPISSRINSKVLTVAWKAVMLPPFFDLGASLPHILWTSNTRQFVIVPPIPCHFQFLFILLHLLRILYLILCALLTPTLTYLSRLISAVSASQMPPDFPQPLPFSGPCWAFYYFCDNTHCVFNAYMYMTDCLTRP